MSILITGANRGIGAGLLAHYRAAGAEVTGTSRRPAAGCEQMDVTEPVSTTALAGRLEGRAIELLICNAGVYLDKGRDVTGAYDPETFADTFAVNVTGVFLTVQAFLPHLRKASVPRIAIVASAMASSERAPGGAYAYRSSKAAAVNLGRNLAVDLKPLGVAVGIYHPGWVRTDMGGAGASIDVDTAVAGLTARFEALTLARTGCFLNYDGAAIPF